MASHGSIMASIDKAAIVFSIAIALIGVGIAVAGNSIDYSSSSSNPIVSTDTVKPTTSSDPFADLADKVKADAPMMEKSMMEEKMMMDEKRMMEEKMMMDEKRMMEEKMMKETAMPTTHSVSIPAGTSVPGCEESNSCFIPADITINVGDTVEWTNDDTAAHTVTSGSPENGPSNLFDSSLLIGGKTFSNTFETAGSYDYFCIVHPWMVGSVSVN